MQKIYCDVCGKLISDYDEVVRFGSDKSDLVYHVNIGDDIRVSQNIDMCKRCYFKIVDMLEKHEPLINIKKEDK